MIVCTKILLWHCHHRMQFYSARRQSQLSKGGSAVNFGAVWVDCVSTLAQWGS